MSHGQLASHVCSAHIASVWRVRVKLFKETANLLKYDILVTLTALTKVHNLGFQMTTKRNLLPVYTGC